MLIYETKEKRQLDIFEDQNVELKILWYSNNRWNMLFNLEVFSNSREQIAIMKN